MSRRTPLAAVAAACLAVTSMSWQARTTSVDLRHLSSLSFPDLVTIVVLSAAVTLSAWLLLILLLSQLGAGGRRVAAAITPRLLRGLVLTGLCGIVVTGPAHADPPPLDGLRLPDRAPSATTPATESDQPPAEVTVRVGDSLWRIAERRTPGARVARIAAEADRLYASNRSVIGPDPDLLRPGQRLTIDGESR